MDKEINSLTDWGKEIDSWGGVDAVIEKLYPQALFLGLGIISTAIYICRYLFFN